MYIEESGKNIPFILYVDFKGLSNVNAWPSVNAKHTLFFVVTWQVVIEYQCVEGMVF